MRQIHKQRVKAAPETQDAVEVTAPEGRDLSDIDELLEEIDELLAGLDQDTATTYVQQGGE